MISKFVVIRGCAGAGKTASLLDIAGEHFAQGVDLHQLAFVSFTRRATEVARERAKVRFGVPKASFPYFRTIHSTAYRALKISADQVMDKPKYSAFSKESGIPLISKQLRAEEEEDPGEAFIEDKNDYVLLEQLYRNNPETFFELTEHYDRAEFMHYMTEYQRFKNARHYVDFTDMLQMYIDQDLVEPVNVAIIDEAQELTPLQWRMLLKAYRNAHTIYLAGDPMQNMYLFSGGDATIIDKIKGEIRVLDHSYRCPQNIVDMALYIMNLTTDIVKWTFTGEDRKGEIHTTSNIYDWDIPDEGTIYMLARTNCLLKPLIEFCLERKIPFQLGKKRYVTNKDLVAYKAGTLSKLKCRYIEDIGIDAPIRATISTVHGVKGGEADHVIFYTDTTHKVERLMAGRKTAYNSELRLLYVAVTRARQSLMIWLSDNAMSYNTILQGAIYGSRQE